MDLKVFFRNIFLYFQNNQTYNFVYDKEYLLLTLLLF